MITSPRRHLRLVAAAAACAIAAVAAGSIAGASASSSTKAHRDRSAANHPELTLRDLARRTVAGSFVISTTHGFVKVTVARGTVESVSGDRITINEGTRRASYGTVTLTLPADTRVRENRKKSTIADVTAGQRVLVLETPTRALVAAHTVADNL